MLFSIGALILAIFVILLFTLKSLVLPLVFLAIAVTILIIFYKTKMSVEKFSRNTLELPKRSQKGPRYLEEDFELPYIKTPTVNTWGKTKGIWPPVGTTPETARATTRVNPKTGREDIVISRPTAFTFCDDSVPVYGDNPNYISVIPNQLNKRTQGVYLTADADQSGNTPVSNWKSLNQRLAGPANPKTLLPPVIVPPPFELEFWKASNLTTHSHVNDMKSIDEFSSGYQVSTCCGGGPTPVVPKPDGPYIIGKATQPKSSNGYKKARYQTNSYNNVGDYTYTKEKFEKQRNIDTEEKKKITRGKDERHVVPVTMDEDRMLYPYDIRAGQPGQVDTECGYNPQQLLESNIPSNIPTGPCERTRNQADYNKALYTQTIQPGVYSFNEVNEPIQSNLGISLDQQLEPVTISTSDSGDSVLFTRHDPRLMGEIIEEPELETVNASNVYDPRYSGYGTSYRAYENKLLGRTDYYYDDINAVRMPNYIVRSKIDFMDGADTYGPMMTPEGSPYTDHIHELADNEFLKCSLQFRSGMQESLMRKTNAESWQKRRMPLGNSMR